MEQYRQFQQLALVMKLVKGGPLFPWLLASLNHSETGLTKPRECGGASSPCGTESVLIFSKKPGI